jgi:glutathione synthase/RimK-type ligase-like ATP-grasp enzyme
VKKCAFLTLDVRGDFVIDDEHAVQPLADLGWQVSIVSWRQRQIPWSRYDAVIIRSTWDYWNDVEGFLEVLQAIDASTRLANSLQLVRWNLAKTYLREVEQKGVAIVPTLWPLQLDAASADGFFDQLDCSEIVIKPVVGANGEDTFRLRRGFDPVELSDITTLFRNRPSMVQRFMPAILAEGEYSLFFFNGAFSHAILKVPAAGEFRSQEERGAEIRPVMPEQRLLQRGQRALATIDPAPLYARIDMVRDQGGDFVVMELELIEPSLYLRTDPGAPTRFAGAIDNWFSAPAG